MGHEHFGECVAALAAGMRNPVHEELSLQAAWALQGVAKRLAEATPAVMRSLTSKSRVHASDTGRKQAPKSSYIVQPICGMCMGSSGA